MKNDNQRKLLRSSGHFAFIFFMAIVISTTASAQVDKYDLTDSPPPLKVIDESERKELNAAKGVKDRTKLALELMEARLKTAALKSDASDYTAMFEELGRFHAIMDDTLGFLDGFSKDRSARLYNFKRLEIGLRRLAPQIELLRRNAPPERERYLFYLSRNVRDARSRAIEPLFGDTVVPNRQQDNR